MAENQFQDIYGNQNEAKSYTFEKVTQPTILTITPITHNAIYGIGQQITLTATFSEPVTVTQTNLNSIYILLNSGGRAYSQGGSNTSDVEFIYTVGVNDIDVTSLGLHTPGNNLVYLNNATIESYTNTGINICLLYTSPSPRD